MCRCLPFTEESPQAIAFYPTLFDQATMASLHQTSARIATQPLASGIPNTQCHCCNLIDPSLYLLHRTTTRTASKLKEFTMITNAPIEFAFVVFALVLVATVVASLMTKSTANEGQKEPGRPANLNSSADVSTSKVA
jgi:hypothetical protein